MCAFGGAKWDGVFFNWMTPQFAAEARKQVEAGAREVGRHPPPVMGYVRTAIGPDADERLAKEESSTATSTRATATTSTGWASPRARSE